MQYTMEKINRLPSYTPSGHCILSPGIYINRCFMLTLISDSLGINTKLVKNAVIILGIA